jgi:putative ABC transport system substrate-binding protein
MKRREFITLLGSTIAAWPVAARAQQSMPVIGFINAASPQKYARPLSAFLKGLGETGYVDGRNVLIKYRWAEGRNDQLPAMVTDLIRRQVTVIAATGTPASLAAKAATATIPIVFQVGTDPVAVGLVASLARPGGNVTGVTNLNTELMPKRLGLLRELMPTANIIALLVNPTSPNVAETVSRDLRSAARPFGLQIHILHATTERDFDTVFATLVHLRASALVIAPDTFFISRSEQLAALTVRHAMPAITQFREFTDAGGLMSYGGSFTESARQVGVYTGRILKGAKPADMPVQQITKVELIINLKTAMALGITVPLPLLGRADEVIE